MELLKIQVSIEIKPYGLAGLLAILKSLDVKNVNVTSLQSFDLSNPSLDVECDWIPRLSVSFECGDSLTPIVDELHELLNKGSMSYYISMIVRPLYRVLKHSASKAQNTMRTVA